MTRPLSPECPGRVFHRYSRWTRMPAQDLLELRHALLSVRNLEQLSGPDATDELLTLVEQELRLRGLTPLAVPRSGAETE